MSRRIQAALPLLIAALTWAGVTLAAAPAGDPTEAPPVWISAQQGAAIKAEGAAEFGLQMILAGRSRKLAVISGEIVKVGDQYKGSKVVAIKADKVVMEDATKSLTMTPDVSKKKPARVPVRKKRVILPAADVSPKAMGSNQ